jgi:hypothetical protein
MTNDPIKKAESEQHQGTPTGESQPAWKSDFDHVRKVGFWVYLFVSLPTLGIPALLSKVLEPGKLGVEEAFSMWSLVKLTAPLTVATAIVGIAILRKWFVGYSLVVFATAILIGATALSHTWGIGTAIESSKATPSGGIPTALTRMLRSYADLYGPWPFFSSLVVGGFLAWVWAEKLWPHLKR